MTASLIASLSLPPNLSKYAGLTLTIEEASLIHCYNSNAIYSDRKDVLFNAGKFTGITFLKRNDSKYSILALPNNLMDGPEYYINENNIKGNEPNEELRHIVIDYLENHKELGLTINNFL